MPKLKLSLITVIALGSLSSLSALQFQTLGYKSTAIGGACVASASGSTASYSNPALLADTKYDAEISVGVGIAVEDRGLIKTFTDLDDADYATEISKLNGSGALITDINIASINAGQAALIASDGNAFRLNPHGAVGFQFGKFGFGVFGAGEAGVQLTVDQTRTASILTDAADPLLAADTDNFYDISSGTAVDVSGVGAAANYFATSFYHGINLGTTNADLRGIAIIEVPISYGTDFSTSYGKFAVGGSLKYMSGTTYNGHIDIGVMDGVTDMNENEVTSSNFGIDLGMLYTPNQLKDLRIGLVGKNLNSPKFDSSVGYADYKVKPMVRTGVAYDVFESLEVAADFDVTANETFFGKEQMLGGGITYEPASWFSVGAGAKQNMHSTDTTGVVYTAGIGLGLKWFQVNLSGEMSSKETTVDGQNFPKYANVNLAIVSKW